MSSSRVSFNAFLVVLAASGCSSSTASPSPTAPTATAGADAAAPSSSAVTALPPAACPAGSRETGDGCETTLTLAASPNAIAPARDHHTTHVFDVAGKSWLYVLGGTPSWKSIYDDIQRARIHEDGSIDPFESAGKMAKPRAGHTTARVDDKVVVIGGSTMRGAGMGVDAGTDIGTLEPDGTIGGWQAGPKLPIGTMHHAMEVKGSWLFVVGGRGASTGKSVAQVVRAKLNDDGTMGEFEKLAELPEPRSHHMSFQYGDYVYVAGGLTGDPMDNPPARTDIIRAKLGTDGSLGEWEPAGTLPKGLSVSAAQVFARHVYFFGGLPKSGDYSNQIQSATIGDDGMLSPAQALPAKLGQARAHVHQTPMFGRFIYSVGGHLQSDESIGDVEIGTFAAP